MKTLHAVKNLRGRPSEKWLYIICIASTFGLLLTSLLWRSGYTATSQEFSQAPQSTNPTPTKPVNDWQICEDMGRGPVPGLTDIRYRVKLCHPDGWVVRAYCLRPLLDPPKVGTVCERTSENTYWCGEGVQPVKEYIIKQTPVPPTPTPTSTPTATLRPPPGGRGFTDLNHYRASIQNLNNAESLDSTLASPTATPFNPSLPTPTVALGYDSPPTPTPTPFQPSYPTPTATPPSPTESYIYGQEHESQSSPINVVGKANESIPSEPSKNFYGIDFTNSSMRIVIQIQPNDRRVNGGRPIVISFFPGDQCLSEDKTACVNAYLNSNSVETIFVTVHSGVGNEGQAFRHAIEGTGYNQAALTLKQVKKNMTSLVGAEVTIIQGDLVVSGLQISSTSRIPANAVSDYIDRPIELALETAAEFDLPLSEYTQSDKPIIVFETCGWRMTGERWAKGVTNTSSSIYIGIIQKSQ